MITGETTELKECGDVSDISEKKETDLDLARNIREHIEQEERPSSINSSSAVAKERRSSLGSFASSGSDTPDLDLENSLAYHNHRKGSIKRTKRYLPPDEPNEVNEKMLMAVIPPESPGLFRNILLSAAVNEAEKERKLSKDTELPASPMLDDLSSSASENVGEDSDIENNEDNILQNTETNNVENNRELSPLRKELSCNDKSAKSETYLLDGNNEQRVSYLNRPKTAPVEVASICTQTEWSWLEDMEIFEKLRSQRQTSIRPLDSAGQPKVQKRRSSTQSNGCAKGRNKEITPENEDSEDELYKEPTIEFSASSSDEEDVTVDLDKESFLPSIGPPKILQYVKESVNPPFKNKFPDKNNIDVDEGTSGDHSCAFCKTENMEIFEESLEQISLSEKSTCPVYEEHLKQQTNHKEDGDFIRDELIDVRPHPPFGTKAARKAAKERAAERAREREMEKQKVSGNTVNFYAMTRQMKTLTYSLASTKCMDDGWTVKRALTPLEREGGEYLEPFDIEINSSRTQKKETFFERFYTSGKRLFVLFPDGTGCCYYPSGNPAVIISSTEKGKYSYILQEDTSEHSRHHTGILGVFEPTGNGACYFHETGKIRMVLTPFGGTYFDNKGEKKKKWQWYNNHGNHVHAPPFQPITFAMTKELSIRCMGQDYIIITYNHGRHTIRFNVGARVKVMTKKAKHHSSEEDYEIHLKEVRQFVNMLIERVQMTLRFPRSTRINKLTLPKPEGKHDKSSRLESRLIAADDAVTVIVN